MANKFLDDAGLSQVASWVKASLSEQKTYVEQVFEKVDTSVLLNDVEVEGAVVKRLCDVDGNDITNTIKELVAPTTFVITDDVTAEKYMFGISNGKLYYKKLVESEVV